jgi:hypothetical protein
MPGEPVQSSTTAHPERNPQAGDARVVVRLEFKTSRIVNARLPRSRVYSASTPESS